MAHPVLSTSAGSSILADDALVVRGQRAPSERTSRSENHAGNLVVPVKTFWAICSLLLAIVFNNIGNFLVKHFADVFDLDPSPKTLLLFIAAGLSCAAALIFYTKALTRFSLSVAYPILIAGSLVGATIAGVILFDESLGFAQYIGIVLIFTGIIVLSANGRRS